MRISFLVAVIGSAIGFHAYAGATKTSYRVNVEITNTANIPVGLLKDGEQAAARIFSGIGIQLTSADKLQEACVPANCIHSSATQDIAVEIIPHAPATFSGAALAMAMPRAVSGVRIAVFYDRIQPLLTGHHASQATILGYVLAHEIGHVLQGVARHSEIGIIRARWMGNDFDQMGSGVLVFTSEDVQLIKRRLIALDASARYSAMLSAKP